MVSFTCRFVLARFGRDDRRRNTRSRQYSFRHITFTMTARLGAVCHSAWPGHARRDVSSEPRVAHFTTCGGKAVCLTSPYSFTLHSLSFCSYSCVYMLAYPAGTQQRSFVSEPSLLLQADSHYNLHAALYDPSHPYLLFLLGESTHHHEPRYFVFHPPAHPQTDVRSSENMAADA